jgi:dienelactone hydrolase
LAVKYRWDPRDPPGRPLETDTLILIGDADDWTPAARCAHWRDAVQTNGHPLIDTAVPLGYALETPPDEDLSRRRSCRGRTS